MYRMDVATDFLYTRLISGISEKILQPCTLQAQLESLCETCVRRLSHSVFTFSMA